MPRILVAVLAAATPVALAQDDADRAAEFELGEDDDWTQTDTPEEGTPEAVFARAQRLIAEGDPNEARSILTRWIEDNKRTPVDGIARAYYLRGVAKLEADDEHDALFDFEIVITRYADTDEYERAIKREVEIAEMYLSGLRKKVLGIRIESGRPTGEEILIRAQERLPGSRLAEAAALRLADHYYNQRDLELAAQMYEIFRANHPDSEHRRYAMLREIQSNIARFKGPSYDASGLIDAKILIERYREQYPAESIRSGITEGLESWLDESAASQTLDTARWYLEVDDETSARFVLARLVRRHPATVAADEALAIMIDRGWIEPPDARAPPVVRVQDARP